MRIVITSDLHYRPAQRDLYLQFAEQVCALEPDCFIIAGDIGHPLRLYQRGLQLFRDLGCPRLVIAGNHDVYRGEYGSRELWQEWLPRVSSDEGFIWLEDTTCVLNGVGICGTMAWYDYSSHAPHLQLNGQEYRQLKHLVNHDADYVDWPWSDVAMARYLGRSFGARLAGLTSDPAVRRIVVVTHMPIFEQAVPRRPESEFWSLMNAYLGNFTLGQMVRDAPKVTHVVSGHLHRRGQWTVPGAYGPIAFHVVGSDETHLALVTLDLSE